MLIGAIIAGFFSAKNARQSTLEAAGQKCCHSVQQGNTMTDAELVALEEKAKAATPGPWACWSTARKILGIDPVDWGLVLANIPEIERPGIIFTANHNLATDAEEEQARKDHTDPGQSGRNCAYVAAANPDVILSLIVELRQARADVAQLEKEADWMAERLHCFCDYNNYCNECALYPCYCQENIERRFEKYVVENWRERAREATEAPCKN